MAKKPVAPIQFGDVSSFGEYVASVVGDQVRTGRASHVELTGPNCSPRQAAKAMVFRADVVSADGGRATVATLSYLCCKGKGGGSCDGKKDYHCRCLNGVREAIGEAGRTLQVSRVDHDEGHAYQFR
jgi:hypothetical protein